MRQTIFLLFSLITLIVVGLSRINEVPSTDKTLKAEIIAIAEDSATITLDIKDLFNNYTITVNEQTEIITTTDTPLRFDQLQVGNEITIIINQNNETFIAEQIMQWQ